MIGNNLLVFLINTHIDNGVEQYRFALTNMNIVNENYLINLIIITYEERYQEEQG